MYPGHIDRLGSDCAGDVLSVGAGVTAFRPGDRVVAMTSGAFASHTVTREAFVAALPRGLDFEQGAAIPTAYLTAWITLVEIARIKRGDRVLIHSGAGGVGMAAIALAVRAGAEVFATAGSTEKRALIAAMGVAHPLDSRSTSFADEVHRLTGGRGVDVVLNSLAGELMDRSFEVLADGGAFLEIGKRGLWSRERVDALDRGLRYHIVDCNDNARDTPELVGSIFRRVLDDIASGALPALPCTTFAFDRARDAFRYMAQARHVGRVVFRHPAPLPPAPVVGPDAAYLVTGGLGGLGLAAARWLAAHGARHLVLAGRSSPTDAAREAIDAMRADGAEVVVVSADAATRDGIERMLDAVTATGSGESPLGGIIHCAGMLDDGALRNLTPDRFAAVMGPKADGAWRLDRRVAARRWTPDFIVYYASMSAVFGAPGQGNYAAANAFLDALAQDRRARGIPTTSIDWGAWSGAGMAARGNTVARAATQGLGTIDLEGGLRVLEAVLRERPPRVAVSPLDLDRLGASIPADAPPGLLSDLLARRRGGATPDESGSGHEVRYIELEPIARRERLADLVRRELGTVLGLGAAVSSIPEEELFSSVGIDSLTAVELRNRIQRAIGRPLPATAAMQWPSIAQMANGLASLFEDVEAQPQAPVGEREVIEI
jgi:NADPH:quinone reductase-like Zn-dependent oxidoreductase/acyl carrier protein